MIDPELKAAIDKLTQLEMARLWRFAPSGSIYFQRDACSYFRERFIALGGFTPEISKQIGWGVGDT
jgi:hypothetical protein